MAHAQTCADKVLRRQQCGELSKEDSLAFVAQLPCEDRGVLRVLAAIYSVDMLGYPHQLQLEDSTCERTCRIALLIALPDNLMSVEQHMTV
jgi:hypothetical protein